LNIHIYIGLVLFFFSPPSSSSSSCIPSTCRDDDRQRRGRSETAYQVKQIFRFFFLFSFILNSLCWTISAPMHSVYIYVYFGLYLGDLKMRTSTKVCAIFSMWSAWMEVTGTKHKRKKISSRLSWTSPPSAIFSFYCHVPSMVPLSCHTILNNHH
jgi:hypothetical protein